MAKKYRVTLTQEEQDRLKGVVRNRSCKAPIVKKAYVLLAADENGANWTDEKIKEAYQSSIRTIERLRARFVEDGFEAAVYGKPRQGESRVRFDGRVEAQLIALRCGDPPSGHNKWTLELLANHLVSLNYVQA